METIVLILHVMIAVAMTGFILLQQGKGAEMGASFGAGASQTVFGSAGSAGFLTKATAVLALLFFVTSITLAIFAKKKVEQPRSIVVPAAAQGPAAQRDVVGADGEHGAAAAAVDHHLAVAFERERLADDGRSGIGAGCEAQHPAGRRHVEPGLQRLGGLRHRRNRHDRQQDQQGMKDSGTHRRGM